MLSGGLQTGSAKAELRALNARLSDYVRRVRELERENRRLEGQLRGRAGQRPEGGAAAARGLRLQLDQLSRATARAEGERDALRRELRALQRLDAEARAARGRLDAELGALQRELRAALDARAGLEGQLAGLHAQRRGLDAAHQRAVRELRGRAAALAVRRPAAPPPSLRDAREGCAALPAGAWRDGVQRYEGEVRALEEALRRGRDLRRRAEEEARLCAREAGALRREAQELARTRAALEDALRRMLRERGPRAQERQRVIECLEDEKAALTLAMADRIRDYQELLQVKSSLSLEVATYRALLEGESNPEILIWMEDIENIPPESRNTSYRYTDSVVQRKNERNLFPRQTVPLAGLNHSSALYSTGSGYHGSQTASSIGSAARKGFLTSGYSSSATTRQENSNEKTVNGQTNFQTSPPTQGLVRKTDVQVKTFPARPKPEGASGSPTFLAKDSTVARESYQEHRDISGAGASKSSRPEERTVIVGKKVEIKATEEQERNRPGASKTKPEEKMFDSKEKASEERNLRWEELTKLDKEARERESQQMKEQARGKGSSKEKRVSEREIPISVEASTARQPEVSRKGLQDAGDAKGREAVTKEMKFKLGTSDTASSLQGNSMTETIAENIVTSILKQFTQSEEDVSPSSFPDTKVTYVDRKELPGAKKTKTEIVVESKLTEDIDVSDEASLDYLLSKDAKEVGLKGKSTERMISDVINLGLSGREGRARVVNVEIVEEPLSYVSAGGAEEFSTPFEVEEADDLSPAAKGLVEEEEHDRDTHGLFSARQHRGTRQPRERMVHVEEVTEAGDSEGEQSYFVSTPDEYPAGQDRDGDGDGDGEEGSVYGQIHIEEESTIKYSWQDEIVQGTWRRKKRGDAVGEKDVQALEIPVSSPKGDTGSAHWKEEASGEFHTEPTVIEKEIKIPHEFHSSMKGGFSKEPRHQLAEVIGQLEETLPERMKEELATLTSEGQAGPGRLSVDVKKVHTSSGESVTLVAEVNLSQTVDADQLDLEELSRDEAGEIEKAVESVVRESLARRHGRAPGSPDREEEAEAPAGGGLFKRWATRELYSASGGGDDASWSSPSVEPPAAQGPVSATVEVSSPRGFAQSHVLEDVRHIKLGPPAEVSGDFRQAGSAETSRSVSHLTWGPDPSQLPREVVFRGAGDTEEPGLADLSTEAGRSGMLSSFSFKQFHAEKEISLQGPVSGVAEVGDSFATEEAAGTQTSVRRLQVGPKEGLRGPIQFIVPLSERVEWGSSEGSVHTQDSPGAGTPIGHFNTGPQGQADEQIVPGCAESKDRVQGEGSADTTQATRSYTVGRKILMTEKSTLHGVISESAQEGSTGDMSGAEVTPAISRSFRNIQLGPTETRTSEHIVIRGPLTKTFALAGSVASSELGQLADSSRAPAPKETSFTFQMDVSNAKAIPSWTREAGMEADAGVPGRGAWTDAGSRNDREAGVSFQALAGAAHRAPGEQGGEKDQRSVISDEKKVALLYLDDEQEEDNDGQWF